MDMVLFRIAGVIRTWLGVNVLYLRSVDTTAKNCHSPTIPLSGAVTCNLVPQLHFAGNYMKLPIPFSFISSNHGTTRQCNRSEDQKAVLEAATPRSFIRFLLQYSADLPRETPSRHQEGTKAKRSSAERPFGPPD
jgi:hypothetical protein